MAPEDDDRDASIDRAAILARRRRFVAATLTGLTTSTLATACPCREVAPTEAPPSTAEPRDDGDPMEEANPYEGGEAPDAEADEDVPEGEAPEGEAVAPEPAGTGSYEAGSSSERRRCSRACTNASSIAATS